jgi:hypothetical protein
MRREGRVVRGIEEVAKCTWESWEHCGKLAMLAIWVC